MSTYGKLNDSERALSVFKMMESWDGKRLPNIDSYNILLHIFGTDEDKILSIEKEIEEKELYPNYLTFGVLINAYLRVKNPTKALEVLDRMSMYFHKPNKIIFSSLISGLLKLHMDGKAYEMYKTMQGHGYSPSLELLVCFINNYAMKNNLDEALKIWHEIPAIGLKPNRKAYSSMIDALLKHGRVEEAEKYFTEMKAAGIIPDCVTYSSLINKYKNVSAERCQQLWNEMVSAGVQADEWAYSIYIRALETNSLPSEDIILEMKRRSTIKAYNSLLYTYGKLNQVNKMEDLWDEIAGHQHVKLNGRSIEIVKKDFSGVVSTSLANKAEAQDQELQEQRKQRTQQLQERLRNEKQEKAQKEKDEEDLRQREYEEKMAPVLQQKVDEEAQWWNMLDTTIQANMEAEEELKKKRAESSSEDDDEDSS
eukprot:CAMPEP_0174252574 /NCGR_PEP_ID=MMETSP0439-20130205/1982_1 /TAXON_ID=0 /ORGANISM="Stereomyxa ramosa, Strain Chinc5" /LENGTH=423 /DNA_ID=CAMNT_0015333129 /DNA_START=324 /DNA_END=1595 /DNA_ORIENTATION=-